MESIILKQKLLSLNILLDNIYLDKYINLIIENNNTKKEKFKTQSHHIIPKQYFKLVNLPVDNSNDNLVNLTFSDHARAHYYLAMCAKNDAFKSGMVLSFKYITSRKLCNNPIDEIINEYEAFNNLQDLYQTCKVHMGKVLSKIISNKVSMYKGDKQYRFDRSLLNDKLAEGYILGMLPTTCKKIAETVSHKIWVTNGKNDICINDTDTIPQGFYQGKSKNYFQLGKTEENETSRRTNISKARQGTHLSNETKQKLSLINKFGEKRTALRKWMNNGTNNTRVLETEIPKYIETGWVLGKIGKNKPCSNIRKEKISLSNRGRIHIVKDGTIKSVKLEDLQSYLNAGWTRMRKVRNEH